MGRKLRWAKSGTTQEISSRVRDGQMRLRPSPKVNDIIVGCIGRARELHPVDLHAFCFLSNHFHMALTAKDSQHISNFVGFVKGNLTRELNRLHGCRGSMWEGRFEAIPISPEEAAQKMRHRYMVAQGVKDGLVARVAEWPGESSARHMLNGTRARGTWKDRTRTYRNGRLKNPVVDPDQEEKIYELEMVPLPFEAELSVQERQAELAETAADIEEEYADLPKMGVEAVLAMDPMHIPPPMERTRAPTVHAASKAECRRMCREIRAVRRVYREASLAYRRGDWGVAFPQGTFRPLGGFVPWDAEVVAACAARAAAGAVWGSEAGPGPDAEPEVAMSSAVGRLQGPRDVA